MSTVGQEHSYLSNTAKLNHLPQRLGWWRTKSRQVIVAVIEEHGIDHPQIRKLVRQAYPFGLRQCWPYKAWLKEVRRALDGEDEEEPEVELDAQGQTTMELEG